VNEAYRKSAERKLAAASQAERGARSLASDAAAKAYSDLEAAEARQEYFAKRVDLTRTRLQETLAALENETATELDAERARIAADAAEAEYENARSARCIALLKLKSLSAPTVEDLLSELMDE
jgi:outer membrane protein TolC